jgi:hypothetical protein
MDEVSKDRFEFPADQFEELAGFLFTRRAEGARWIRMLEPRCSAGKGLVRSLLGGEEGPASPGARLPTSRIRLEAVE